MNVRSPAATLNINRYGHVKLPPNADAKAAPKWLRIRPGSTYTWHDHRIHWMSTIDPPAVRNARGSAHHIFDWSVPLIVDSRREAVRGTLDYVPAESTSRWWLVAPVAALLGAIALFTFTSPRFKARGRRSGRAPRRRSSRRRCRSAVEVLDVARLAEVVDAEAGDRRAAHGARGRRACAGGRRARSRSARARSAGNRSSRIASSPSAQALPRLQRAEDEVGGGEADDVDRRCRRRDSSSAAASTSGTTAPIADERDVGRAARPRAGGSRRRAPAGAAPRAPPGRRARAASAWSIGRVREAEVGRACRRRGRAARARAAASTRGPGRRPAPRRCSAAARGRSTA